MMATVNIYFCLSRFFFLSLQVAMTIITCPCLFFSLSRQRRTWMKIKLTLAQKDMNAYLAFETKSSWSVSGLHSGIRIKIPVKWGEIAFCFFLFCSTIYHMMPCRRNRNLQVQCQATFRRRFYDDLCKQDFWPERRFVPAWRSYRDSRYAFTHVFFSHLMCKGWISGLAMHIYYI